MSYLCSQIWLVQLLQTQYVNHFWPMHTKAGMSMYRKCYSQRLFNNSNDRQHRVSTVIHGLQTKKRSLAFFTFPAFSKYL
jgi:hypothetical protein